MATRQKVPIVPRWPSVATVGLLPNVAGSPTQSSHVQAGDDCFVTGVGALFVCTDPTLGAAVWTQQGGRQQAVLWEWNGTDLSQFDAPEGDAGITWDITTYSTYQTAGTYWDPDAATKNCLRATTSNVAPRIWGLPIRTSSIAGGLPQRFILEARVACQNANTVFVFAPYWENYQHYVGTLVNSVGVMAATLRDNAAFVDGLVFNNAANGHVFGALRRIAAHVVPATGSTKPQVALAVPDRYDDRVLPWHEPRAQASFNNTWLGLAHNPRIALVARSWHNAAGNIAISDVRILSA